ncbi:hypothetical protein QBC45DRAFT_395685 [Copromyces sp. CBS 386.78]|nr:hypothetical protein QBC45DRAFT_395685 [Copromyces sp. CBS 386.78]
MDYGEDDEVVMQVWDTSDLPPRPLESATEGLSKTSQPQNPNVGEESPIEEVTSEEAKRKESEAAEEARKGSKKRKAPSDEEHEYKIKRLCKELKSYYALCKKGDGIERMLPEANRLLAAAQEKCKILKLEAEASKKEAAKKPRRGPGRPRRETTAPEPASRMSPPPTSGSDCSEPSEQTVASAADSGEPTPTAAATTTKPPTPNSETNKGPSKSPRAIKAATGARKPPGRRLTPRHTHTHDELD